MTLQLYPDYQMAWQGFIETLRKLNRGDESLRYYDDLLKEDPKNIRALLNTGYAADRAKQFDLSQEMYQRIVEIDPNLTDAWVSLGFAHYQQGYPYGAIDAYTHAINLSPNLSVAYVNRGAAYQEVDLDDKALTDFTTALKLDPENRDASYGMGRSLFKQGKISEAFPYFEKINDQLYMARIYDALYRGYPRFTNNYPYWWHTYHW
jgi:tetratricopeptide (TPR) repeat protein